jgi:hypothetical protein
VLTDFAGHTVDVATAVAIQADGKIVAVGGSDLARYTSDGRLDPSFGMGGKVITTFGFGVAGVAIQPDADFTGTKDLNRPELARIRMVARTERRRP